MSVVYYAATTLDGYIAEVDDTIDWLTGYQGRYDGDDAAPARGYEEFYAGVGALVAGSVTYERVVDMVASAGDRRLWVVGGGGVASQFADAGLLDEVEVTVVPVVLAGGKPLFGRRLEGGPMQLERVIPRASGMVELRFSIPR